MRKQSLIHLHHLTIELRSWLAESHDIDGQFDPYDAEGVSPYEIHRRKAAHEEAVQSCMDGVVAVIEEAETRGQSVDGIADH